MQALRSIAPPPVEWKDVFLKNSHSRQYPAKTILIHHGDTSETLYFIVSGSVSIVAEGPDGKEVVLTYLHKDNFFGEMGLFEPDGKRSAMVIARTKCQVAEMSYDQFRRLTAEHPELLYQMSAQMASRLQDASEKVSDMVFLDVQKRVARTLLALAKMPDAITHPEGMQIRITRQEIARMVGCSREMVGRVLRVLEHQDENDGQPDGGFKHKKPLVRARGKTMVIFGTR